MPIFDNPNSPEQPEKGVYYWYCEKGGKSKNIYVGNAGRKNTKLKKGTLSRGVIEGQRGNALSSDKGKNLDTDFIVGTVISCFEKNGWTCHWKHIMNSKPEEEKDKCIDLEPILQNRDKYITRIKKEYRFEGKGINGKWKTTRENMKHATKLIFEKLENEF